MNAFTWKAKGTITFYGIENDFTSTVTIKALDQFKRVYRNDRYTGVVVLDGAKGWRNSGTTLLNWKANCWPARSATSITRSSRSPSWHTGTASGMKPAVKRRLATRRL